MDNQKSKKKSPALFFIASFLAVIIIAVIANRQSSLYKEITIPLNNGILSLFTYDNFLAAVSFDNKTYLFDWNDLSKKYQTIPIKYDQMVLLKNGTIVSVSKYNAKSVAITSIKDNTKPREFALDTSENKTFLKIGKNRNEPILIIAKPKSNQTTLTFYTIDPNKDSPQYEFTIDSPIDINQRIYAAVSDDENLVSLCGGKGPPKAGWIALCDLKEKKIAWENQLPEPSLFFNCEFSPDSKLIYARGSDSTVYKFDGNTGRLVGQFLPTKENRSTIKNPHVQLVQVSSDGALVAAVVSGVVCVWDTATGKKIFNETPGHKVMSDIVFSPDSKFLATSDSRQGGKLKIWRIPAH